MATDDSGQIRLRRWTPFTFLVPDRYLDRDEWWKTFDLIEWSRSEYEWTEDWWNGYRDFAQKPRETVDRCRGDCEDYALVSLPWTIAQERSGVGIAFCWELPYPWPTHVIAFDDERVYSSGVVSRMGVDEWVLSCLSPAPEGTVHLLASGMP